ncbi:sufE-like protein 1, chloroplastic/mitochondrial [Pistacia vera]|uniref:sufE-like protein 1, chloroplastic/mitochondrial n=1 Tax=Pistacia vera TaxID=55513 RepID=UPI001263D745|nr:sufE-like protein 1, chloroplastic/mitochondrial [Pistacia vera]
MASSSISSSLRLFTTKSILTPKPRKNLSFFYKPLTFTNISLSPSLVCRSSATSSLQPLEQLPPKLQDIIKLFQSVQEPKAKYEQLLFYGKNLKPLDTQFKTRENKVEGCVSQVWVRAYFDEQKNVVFEADSDSVLTKGLAALLVQGLSHRPVEEIVKVSPDFVVLLGLQQSLTPSRNNGFLNMLKLMQKKALELFLEAEKAKGSVQGSNSGAKIESSGKDSILIDDNGKISNLEGTLESSVEMNEKLEELGSRGMRIREKLEKELRPVELEVEDISYQHAGHAGVKGSDGETHFNVKVVSEEFEGKSLVKRHRLIYGLLQDELQSGLHALSIVAKLPSEVEGR